MRVALEVVERSDGTWSAEVSASDDGEQWEVTDGLSLDAAIELVTETMRHDQESI